MPKRTPPKPTAPRGDWLAWGLLLVASALALCLLTCEPQSPSNVRTETSANLFGPAGDQLAEQLSDALGLGLYVLLAGWFTVAGMLLLRRAGYARRLTGWALLLPGSLVAADAIGRDFVGASWLGGGGALGAWLAVALQDFLSPIALWSLVGGLLALGLWLTADFILLALARTLGRLVPKSSPRPAWKPQLVHVDDDLEEAGAAASDDDGNIIPIHRPKVVIPPPPEPEPDLEPEVAAPKLKILPLQRAAKKSTPEPEPEVAAKDFQLPSLTLLADPDPFPFEQHDQKLREVAVLLEKVFRDFELNVRVVGINTGPVITQYEVALETGMRLNKITVMADDLALNLKVPTVRVVAPIPGKNTVGIEVPNEHRATVRIKEVILASAKQIAKSKIPLFLGKDTEGRPLVYDLAEMPHLLIAGRTGTGKSVCLNTIILSMLMTRSPDEVKMIMIDPKMLELSEYSKLPHLMSPVVKDMRKAEAILGWAVEKMEERYDLLSRARVRNIATYNELGLDEILRRVQPDDEEKKRIQAKMPYIVIFVDEMGDLMMTMKREVEGHIIRLAQKSRAAGIHLVVATQKPTVDVITGLIKSNLPARICFQVSSRSDSRVVLDEMGAEKLLGKGDMLFLQPGTSQIMRSQGAYASDEEITRVVVELECEKPQYAAELMQLKTKEEKEKEEKSAPKQREELYDQAVEIVVREGRGSVSLLQRALGIGYGKAARFIDFMAEDGIVGSYNGSNAREVLISPEDWSAMRERQTAEV